MVRVHLSPSGAGSGARKTEKQESKDKARGGVAQLGEHLPCKQGVKSSNLSVSIRREAAEAGKPEKADREPAGALHLENCTYRKKWNLLQQFSHIRFSLRVMPA